MDVNQILNFLDKYGMFVLFAIVLLEYLNLPGFPAGVVFPVSGIWAHNSGENVIVVLAISIVAGVIGSLGLYYVGKFGGERLLEGYLKKFPSQRKGTEHCFAKLNKHGNVMVLISKLIPGIRTLVGIPAGVIDMDIKDYIVYSAMGIFMWNTVLILVGYFFSDAVLQSFIA